MMEQMKEQIKNLLAKIDAKMTPEAISVVEKALVGLTGTSCFLFLSELAKGDCGRGLQLAGLLTTTMIGFIATKQVYQHKNEKIVTNFFHQPAARSEILAELFSEMTPQN